VGLGKVAINTVPVAINQDLKALIPSAPVIPEFLLFRIRQSATELRRMGQGTTVKGIRQDDLLKLPLRVPPLAVQERIAQTLSLADQIRRKRRLAVELAERILTSAFAEMFEDPSINPRKWPLKELGALADIRSGVTKGRPLEGKATVDVPYLRVANVQDGFLELSDVKTIAVTAAEAERYRLESGDVLMTEGGDPDKVGRGAIWRGAIESCVYQNHVFRVRTERSMLVPEYLVALLRTPYAKAYFLRAAKRSSNLASINATQVRAFGVPVPPIALQRKFVVLVQHWERTKGRLERAVEEADALFLSLLNDAFSDDLSDRWSAIE
jgi:type I restriction enzyme S subunit